VLGPAWLGDSEKAFLVEFVDENGGLGVRLRKPKWPKKPK
jgi:hypothetical protein